MSDDVPALYPSATELWQYAQAVNALGALSARLRVVVAGTREREARLAFSDAEHAARHHEARRCPPLRLMTDDEQVGWQRRVPRVLAAGQDDEPFTVWTAQLVDADAGWTGEWGVEAHAWQQGAATFSLFAVCRDAEDALA